MKPEVTLLGTGIGGPKGPDTGMKDDKHNTLDPWQPKKVTWDQVLQTDQTAQVMYGAGLAPVEFRLMASLLVSLHTPQ
ncbi:MAG: hypothetical protein Q9196_007237 [Gyalolechia fulgens]